MPYRVGLEENVQRSVTASQRPGLSEATRALTDPGAPEEAGKIHPGDGPCQVPPFFLEAMLRIGRSVVGSRAWKSNFSRVKKTVGHVIKFWLCTKAIKFTFVSYLFGSF